MFEAFHPQHLGVVTIKGPSEHGETHYYSNFIWNIVNDFYKKNFLQVCAKI